MVLNPTAQTRGFWILNILRYINVLSLLCAIAASWAVLIKGFVATKFFFFDSMSQLFFSLILLNLILSELSIASKYFSECWPLFSASSSLVALGVTEIFLGFQLLGFLNEEFAAVEMLGQVLYALLMASGIAVLVMGVLSLFLSFVYRDRHAGLTARSVRSWALRKQMASRPPTPDFIEKGSFEIDHEVRKPKSVYLVHQHRGEYPVSVGPMGKWQEKAYELATQRSELGAVKKEEGEEYRVKDRRDDGWRAPPPRAESPESERSATSVYSRMVGGTKLEGRVGYDAYKYWRGK